MTIELIAAFWAVSVLFVLAPGADWAFAITAGMHNRAILPAVGGLLAGHLLATFVVAAGVGALITKMPFALAIMTIAGALYLLWLGIGMVWSPAVPTAAIPTETMSWFRWALRGLGVSGMNPKVFLLFLALLPQFTDVAGPWPVAVQMLILGIVHVTTCGVVYSVVAFASHSLLRTRPSAARVVGRVSGMAMVAIALILIWEQV